MTEIVDTNIQESSEAIRKANILYVEDDPKIRRLQELNFSSSGLTFSLASNGQEALQILSEKPADLLLTDYHMPGMNGVELAEQAKKIAPQILVALISAGGFSDEEIAGFKERGIDGYLPKPFTFDQMTNLMQDMQERMGEAA